MAHRPPTDIDVPRTAPAGGLVSVGYEGHTLDSFVEHLVAGHVRAVADVRLNAVSRWPGFSKNRRRAGLADAGIDYVHLRALGNPQHNREPFHTGRVAEGCHAYRQQISHPDAAQALAELGELARARPTAVLCVERDEAACHRQVVIDILITRHGLHRTVA